MRKFLFFLGVAVLAWIFVVPGCGTKFSCDSAMAVAHADDGSCPASVEGAAADQQWAAARLATIADKHVTTGLFYDEDGVEQQYTSGEKDDHAKLATEILVDVGVEEPRAGPFAVASHVEVKVAALMHENDIDKGVLVINNPSGPCSPGCQEVLQLVLPAGASLTVWWRSGDTSPTRALTFMGKEK